MASFEAVFSSAHDQVLTINQERRQKSVIHVLKLSNQDLSNVPLRCRVYLFCSLLRQEELILDDGRAHGRGQLEVVRLEEVLVR